ncbi:MAG: GTP-binding protein [Pseudomonadota bacterium]
MPTSPHVPAHHNSTALLSLAPRAIVLSGTLGSGKTTLLNHLLTSQTKSATPGSFVVIENDIGTTNTDTTRLQTDPTNVLGITAGCICCNDLHSLRAAVTQLRKQPELRTIFIETTGIANPATVKDLLHELEIPTLVIVTVDVRHFEENKSLGRITDTIPHADILALTWTQDAAGQRNSAGLEKVLAEVSELNPLASTVEVARSGEPLHEIALTTSLSAKAKPKTIIQAPGGRAASSQYPEIPLFTPGMKSFANRIAARHHQEYTITLQIPSSMTPDDVIAAVTSGAPTGLLRAKGRVGRIELDCTNGDWNISEGTTTSSPSFITLIGTKPLTAEAFPALASTSSNDELSVDLADPLIRARAIQLVTDLMSRIPSEVVQNDRLITETDAGEAWRYVSLPGFPEELKETFLRSLCEFYLKQSDALQSGRFNSHPALPYYQREVGYNLSWFLIDCGDLVAKWEMDSRIRSINPVTLYFTGLQNARDARHIGSFKESDVPYLQKRLEMLLAEGQPLSHASQAIDNCVKLCLDRSWNRALRPLKHANLPASTATSERV